jgi:hypothetical protein
MFRSHTIVKFSAASGLAVMLSLAASVSQAGNAFGLVYSSGFKDVMDWHDDHLYVDSEGLGLGFSYRYIHEFDPNLRMDIGAGFFGIYGDIDYTDIPLTLTVGYNLITDGTFKPYIRGGLSYHIMDGDYVESEADVGLFGAFGVEFGKKIAFFAEIAMDTAEATFDTSAGNTAWERDKSQDDITINDVMLTMGVKF